MKDAELPQAHEPGWRMAGEPHVACSPPFAHKTAAAPMRDIEKSNDGHDAAQLDAFWRCARWRDTPWRRVGVSALIATCMSLLLVTMAMAMTASGRAAMMASAFPRSVFQTDQTLSSQTHVGAGRHQCEDFLDAGYLTQEPFSLILTADPGDFSGVSEAHHVLANLDRRRDLQRDRSVCGLVSTGMLMGQFVVVATTGIGPSAASLCTMEILRACGPSIKDALYFGTSGWSPQRGGLLNPPDCSEANWNEDKTRVGDVCVSPLSVNWVCKKASWQQQAEGQPNQCVRPEEDNSPHDDFLFGECMFYRDNLQKNLDFADEIIKASRSHHGQANFPDRPEAVTEHEADYWSKVAAGTGMERPDFDEHQPARVWDYTECMEVDGQFFYNGVPWELKAREYAAATLKAAAVELERTGINAHLSQVLAESASPTSVVAVSAMEAVGVSEALLRYHSLRSTTRAIPFSNVRANSNWMVDPLQRGPGDTWVLGERVKDDFVHGYAHGIAAGSVAILNMFQTRCNSLREANYSSDAECDFEVDSDEFLYFLQNKQGAHAQLVYV